MVSLYRHYNGLGKLLYIGISSNHLTRLREHSQAAEWYEQIKRIEVEHYPDFESALKAEKTAIQKEKPIYNFTHNKRDIKIFEKDTPKQKVNESVISQYPLVVAERNLIEGFYAKRWSIDWISDHFGTTPEVIKYVLEHDAFKAKKRLMRGVGLRMEVGI